MGWFSCCWNTAKTSKRHGHTFMGIFAWECGMDLWNSEKVNSLTSLHPPVQELQEICRREPEAMEWWEKITDAEKENKSIGFLKYVGHPSGAFRAVSIVGVLGRIPVDPQKRFWSPCVLVRDGILCSFRADLHPLWHKWFVLGYLTGLHFWKSSVLWRLSWGIPSEILISSGLC